MIAGRPPMQQDSHPEYNMPPPMHNGSQFSDILSRSSTQDRKSLVRSSPKKGEYDEMM